MIMGLRMLLGWLSPKLVAAHRMLRDQEHASNSSLHSRDAASLNIDLYMHVIESEATKGNATSEVVQQQVDVIVDTFAKYNILINYKGVDHTVNNSWATGAYSQMYYRGLALRKGDYLSLNIYIVDVLGKNGLGFCTFPHRADFIPGVDEPMDHDEILDDSSKFIPIDGCTIASYTLPGRSFHGVPSEGITVIHEIGHWLGLLHTFQGDNREGPGDLVQDTRVQANESYDCPIGRISCPNATFQATPEDPIHNFMDYSDDACLTEFTQGQMIRAFGIWPLFRIAQNQVSVAPTSAEPTQTAGVTMSTELSMSTIPSAISSVATTDQSPASMTMVTPGMIPTALSDIGQWVQALESAKLGEVSDILHVTMTTPGSAPIATPVDANLLDVTIQGLSQAPQAGICVPSVMTILATMSC